MQLIKGKTQLQGAWNATFVKGKGYTRFPETIIQEAVDMTSKAPKE
jgi:acyl carrier protein phosphodiesterase